MDSYKLARLMLDNKARRYGLQDKLKNIDVSACLLDELQVPECGYNCLHLSVLEDDFKLTRQLLDRGADLLKQGTLNGYTPLHRFIIEKPYNEGRKVNKLEGSLTKHPIVDTLLSAQVRKNEVHNPKCSTGLSHLHIACMVDHPQAVEMFLKAGESVNLAVDTSASLFAGYTPLHLAVRYSSIAAAKLLFYRGADMHQKDAIGDSPLHKLLQRLILIANYITMGKPAPSTLLVKELKKLETMVGSILTTKKKSRDDFTDSLGLSAFHVACTLRDPSTVEKLLQGDVDVNKPLNRGPHLWSGWTALHFAACCSVETVELLLQYGADITIKNAKGITPLDMCARRYTPAVIHSILSIREEFREILLSDGSTNLLDLLLAMDNCDEFNRFLQNMPDVNAIVPLDSPIWAGYNVLHLAISMHEKTKDAGGYVQKMLVIPFENRREQQCTCKEEEAKTYWKRIVVCLVRRCSLVTKNAAGLTPVHLAFQLRKANVVDKLLNTCCSSSANEVDESSDLSFLHMACVVGKKNVVERFLDDINAPVRIGFDWCREGLSLLVQTNSTPLHMAVQFDHHEIVEFILQQKKVNVYAKDSLGFTPIHLSIVSQPAAHMFLGKITKLRDVLSDEGLSHVHVAALADDDKAIEALVSNGANVNVSFRPIGNIDHILARFVRETPLHVAVKHGNMKAVTALIEADADIFAATFKSKFDTPLQAVTWNEFSKFIPQFAKKLRRDKRLKGPIEPCGVTLLHFACATFDFKWANLLLEKGADPNAQICADEDYGGDWKGFAVLHAILTRGSSLKGKFDKLTEMVMLLLKYGADVTLQDEAGYSPMLLAEKFAVDALWKEEKSQTKEELGVSAHMFSIADLLLRSQQSFAINPTTRREGSTHFHYACKANRLEIAKKFLKSGIDVNHAKRLIPAEDGGYTPLHFAVACRSRDIIWLLLDHNADVTARDVHGNTPLHLATKNNVDDVNLFEKLCSLGADVNAKNYDDVTPLDMLLHSDCISHRKLKFFLDRECSLKVDDESDVNIVGLLLSNADPDDRDEIFTLMFESCDLIEKIKNGFNAIKSLVGFTPNSQWPEPRRWTVNMFLEAIQIFVDMGCDVNQQNSLGITALHEAMAYCNAQAVEALLLLGANINIADNQGRVPMLTRIRSSNSEQEMKRLTSNVTVHAWKMRFAGLEIDCVNGFAVDETGAVVHVKLEERCRGELQKTAQTKVGARWTMKDFLSDSGVITEYKTLSRVERHSIDKVFKAHAQLRMDFPELCGVLMTQYNKMSRTRQ